MRILYFGPLSGTCLDRAHAFRRMGHEVTHLDVRNMLPKTPWVDRVVWRLGGHWLQWLVTPRLKAALRGQHFDLCHVDNGEWFDASHVQLLKQHADKVVNYNIDDPTGPRDGPRFAAYRRAVPEYDLLAVVREDNLPELQALGARHTLRVWRSADEVSHAPRTLSPADHKRWGSEVLFLGTWMPERGPFLLKLVQLGVPLSIRGPNWQKAPEWPRLQAHWRGGSIGGDDYARAIQCAKVNLGLLSKGNRDLHTTRSLEIPALGAVFCAERTPEHQATYTEGEEAVFWADAEECARQCRWLLADEPRRLAMAERGHQRFLSNRHGNQDILQQMLDAAEKV
jgi:spore maturation protein CgeB